MGHYSFLRDLEESKIAVAAVSKYLSDTYSDCKVEELPRVRQHEGDLEVELEDGDKFTVEVKYDILAKKTGNLCFETHNGKGDLTGISSTDADDVCYVVPKKNGFTLYIFKTDALRKYLFDPINTKKIRQVYGGDKKKFSMMLVSIYNIENDEVCFVKEELDA